MANGINVSITNIDAAKQRASEIIQELQGCTLAAKSAADSAKSALGGSTELANALESKIAAVNEQTLCTAKNSIDNMFANMGTISQTYTSLKDDILTQINNYQKSE